MDDETAGLDAGTLRTNLLLSASESMAILNIMTALAHSMTTAAATTTSDATQPNSRRTDFHRPTCETTCDMPTNLERMRD